MRTASENGTIGRLNTDITVTGDNNVIIKAEGTESMTRIDCILTISELSKIATVASKLKKMINPTAKRRIKKTARRGKR